MNSHRKPTAAQQRAITERRASVVLASGAGCGKTTVLTARYLSHLRDDGASVRELVAITFTDKAARQMRGKIRDALLLELRHSASPAERERWKTHLRDLDGAAITTIHSFCGTLLRQHALDLGIDPGFEILEEVLAFNLRSDSLRDSLHGLLARQQPPADDLGALVVLYGWRPVVDAIERLVTEADPLAWREWLARPAADVAADWLDGIGTSAVPAHVAFLARFHPHVRRCLHLLRTTPCTGPLMKASVAQVLAGIDDFPGLLPWGDALDTIVEAAKVSKERAKAWPDEEVYETIQKAMAKFRETVKKKTEPFRVWAGLDAAEAVRAVEVGQRFLRVALYCSERYSIAKRRAARADFNDLLSLTRDLLRTRPAARKALQNRYRYILVDELQDTDALQMELVETLCSDPANGRSWGAGKLFAVGDAQQSIYRFRGAEVELFEHLRDGVPEPGQLRLSENFRSQPEILKFANALLAGHLSGHEPLVPTKPQLNPDPCIEFLWTPVTKETGAEAARSLEADRIGRRLARMIDRGERIVVDSETKQLRPVRPSDIVLLFRSMSHVALYEAGLRDHGLDYYLVGGRAFFAQQEVYDLLMLLRALDNPTDALSLAGALRSPFGGLSDEALFWLAEHPAGIWAGLTDPATRQKLDPAERPAAERVATLFEGWRAAKDRLPIADLLNKTFAESGYDAALQFERLGDRKLANLWKLVDHARTFDRSNLYGLAGFIDRLGRLVEEQPKEEQAATMPENADVVRLMTIHQAKGLEFPVVVLPDFAAQSGGAPGPAAVWDRQLGCVARAPDEEPPLFHHLGHILRGLAETVAESQEDLRTLYVAVTRPESFLIVSGSLVEGAAEKNTAFICLADRFDPQTGACLADDVPESERPQVRVVPRDEASDVAPGPPDRRRLGQALTAEDGRRCVPAAPEWTGNDLDAAALAVMAGPPTALFETDDEAEEDPGRKAVRVVLRCWPFAEAERWAELLADVVKAVPSPKKAKKTRISAEPLLAWFANHELRVELAGAAECYREVPFALPADGVAPGLAGTLDLVWRATEHEPWRAVVSVWTASERERQLRAFWALEALRGQYGEVAEVAVIDWPERRIVRTTGAELDAAVLRRERTAAWLRWCAEHRESV